MVGKGFGELIHVLDQTSDQPGWLCTLLSCPVSACDVQRVLGLGLVASVQLQTAQIGISSAGSLWLLMAWHHSLFRML